MMKWYICLSCIWHWLFIRFYLFQSHSILAHPPASVYSFIFISGICRSDMGIFLKARDENMPVQASLFADGPGAGTAQPLLTSFVCPHLCV